MRTAAGLLAGFLLGCGVAAPAAAQDAGATATQLPAPPSVGAARRPDEPSPAQALSLDAFGRPLTLGLSWAVSSERRLNFDLDATSQRGRDVLEHEIKLDARWQAGSDATLFLQAVALPERRRALRDGSVQEKHPWERGQTWLLLQRLGGLPLSLQLGRVALIERRSWWWDDDLDAVRLSYDDAGLRIDTGLARELLKRASSDPGVDPGLKGVTRWFGHASQRWAAGHTLEGFWLLARDGSGTPAPGTLHDSGREDAADARLGWLGGRASGQWRLGAGHRLGYRADLAFLRGRETTTAFGKGPGGRLQAAASASRRLRGQAYDLGAQWVLPGAARPTFSLGWAQGSGGGADGSVDRNFRQTGLQENKGRVGGVKRVRYYGELLNPELANLRVATVGFGLRAFDNSSVELLLHRYRQRVASTTVAGSRLSQAPLGLQRTLGREFDLRLAVREWQNLELVLTLATFRPGAAFAADRQAAANSVEFEFTLAF